ncbi:hypothetical protein DWX98_11675 [Blautia sp. AF22-5LB]|nr:hypothetical protein DWX98_11675 [Blautia sp. AF22-5LB]
MQKLSELDKWFAWLRTCEIALALGDFILYMEEFGKKYCFVIQFYRWKLNNILAETNAREKDVNEQ